MRDIREIVEDVRNASGPEILLVSENDSWSDGLFGDGVATLFPVGVVAPLRELAAAVGELGFGRVEIPFAPVRMAPVTTEFADDGVSFDDLATRSREDGNVGEYWGSVALWGPEPGVSEESRVIFHMEERDGDAGCDFELSLDRMEQAAAEGAENGQDNRDGPTA